MEYPTAAGFEQAESRRQDTIVRDDYRSDSPRAWVQNGYVGNGTRCVSTHTTTESVAFQEVHDLSWPLVDGRASLVVVS